MRSRKVKQKLATLSSSILAPNENFILPVENEINYLIKDLSDVGGTDIPERDIEIECRILPEGDTGSVNKFINVLGWLTQKYPNVKPVEFREIKHSIPEQDFRIGYKGSFVVRSNQDPISKFKKIGNIEIRLKSVTDIIPRIGLAVETTTFDFKPTSAQTFDTMRTRWSFPIKYNNERGKIDLTRTVPTNNKINVSYSIEIEIDTDTIGEVIRDDQMFMLDIWLKEVIRVMDRSGVFMTTPEKKFLSVDFNKALKLKMDSIPSGILNKPKDLQKRDLSFLSPERSRLFMQLDNYDNDVETSLNNLRTFNLHKPLFSIPGGYTVSLKADGNRSLVFFHESGIYLINPKFRTVITKISGEGTKYPETVNIIPQTILDAEIISKLNNEGLTENYEILAFDILAYKGEDTRGISSRGILGEERYRSYTSRLLLLKEAINEFKALKDGKTVPRLKSYPNLKFIQIEKKPTYVLPHVGQIDRKVPFSNTLTFFEIMETLVEESRKEQNTNGIRWITDGVIYTPTDRPYQEIPGVDVVYIDKSRNKSLIRKWKENITIDFLPRRTRLGVLTIMAFETRSKRLRSSEPCPLPFLGTSSFKWNGNVELTEDMEERVFEFEWKYSKKFLDYAFVPVRERVDKGIPNTMEVAEDDWNLINDPITVDDLTGNSLTLMRRYHNKVKVALLNELASKTKDAVLLDIGSGRGGDKFKWSRFKRVYAVEPDKKNLREFISRLEERSSISPEIIAEAEKDKNITLHYSRASSIHSRSVVIEKVFPSRKRKGDVTNITLINAEGENIERLKKKVPIGEVTSVSMFNVMTFFYKDIERVQSIINTVKTFLLPGGYFYMIVFDGELLMNSMQDHNTIKTRNLTISRSPDETNRKIFIKIESGIVRGQFEYLVQPREFVQIMDTNGFRLIDERYLNEETFLSNEEYWFSSMSKVLKFRFFSGSIKTEIRNFSKSLIENMMKNKALRPLDPDENPVSVNSSKLKVKGIVRFGVLQDGSCYLHAIFRAFSKTYKNLTIAERSGFIIQIRKELAENYTREIHDSIGNGFFKTSGVKAYEYQNMKKNLANVSFWIPNELMEYIGDQLKVNIFILNGIDATPYKFGNTTDVVKPNRLNVVLYWINGNHYETIGIVEQQMTVRTAFDGNHPLITAIKQLL